MAQINKGKKFESVFKECWEKSFPTSFIYRLPDQQSQYYGTSSNPCDFICYENQHLFLIECKTHKGNTFPLSAFSQYDKLLRYKNINGVVPGLIIWFQDHDKVLWVDINELEKIVNDGNKSINIKMLNDKKYDIVIVPSFKLRTYMKSDYNFLREKYNEFG